MNFNDAMSAAAHKASEAVDITMRETRLGHLTDEDDITPDLLATIRGALSGQIGGLTWTSSVVRHHAGAAAEEKRTGADMLIHVSLKTTTEQFSKGVLVQAKRLDAGQNMSTAEMKRLQAQCGRMLAHTASSFVFDYSPLSMRVGSAARIEHTKERNLYELCGWTPYRFFLELFRCPIGDPRLKSALVRELPVPYELDISAVGEFS